MLYYYYYYYYIVVLCSKISSLYSSIVSGLATRCYSDRNIRHLFLNIVNSAKGIGLLFNVSFT
jgi:hypothetical protein